MVTVHWFNGSGTCERLHFMIDKFCDSRYMKQVSSLRSQLEYWNVGPPWRDMRIISGAM